MLIYTCKLRYLAGFCLVLPSLATLCRGLTIFQQASINWSGSLDHPCDARTAYIKAFRDADTGDFKLLLIYVEANATT